MVDTQGNPLLVLVAILVGIVGLVTITLFMRRTKASHYESVVLGFIFGTLFMGVLLTYVFV